MPTRGSFDTLLRWALVTVALALPCLLGFLATYALLVIAVAAAVPLLLPKLRRQLAVRLDLAGRLFLLAWLILTAVIVIDALHIGQPRDILYAFDFGMLLLYAPMASLLERGAGPRGAALVADLALAGVVIAALVALAEELIFHPARAGFIANDPIRFGDSALLLGFIALAGIAVHPGPRRWLYLLGPVLAIGVDLLAGARSALVAFPVLAVLAALLLVRRRVAAALIAAGTVVLFGAFIVIAAVGRDDRVNSLFETATSMWGGSAIADESTRDRIALYRAGSEVFFESPWLGVGWRERMPSVAALLPQDEKVLGGLPHLHNEVLNFGVGAGVIGIAVYALLLAIPFIALAKSPRDSQFRHRLYAVSMVVAGYILLGLADVMVGFETHTALYVAWMAVLLAFCRDDPAPRQGNDVAALDARPVVE